MGKRKMIICETFVVGEWADGYGKKLAPFMIISHFFDDLRNQSFVFPLCILLIENAVLLCTDITATEQIFAVIKTVDGVVQIVPAVVRIGIETTVAHTDFFE